MNFTNHCNQYYPVSRDIIIRQDCVWKCHLALKSPAFNGSGQGLHNTVSIHIQTNLQRVLVHLTSLFLLV